MPSERTRALRQAGELLQEILRRKDLPEDIRLMALTAARHYPDKEDIEYRAAHQGDDFILGPWLGPEWP